MAVETFQIVITVGGVGRAAGGIRRVRRETDALNKSLAFLRSALVVFASARILSGIVGFVDTFTNLQNKLRIVTDGAQNLVDVQNALFDVSQRTRSSFEDNVDLFSKMARATERFGLGQEQLLTITERVNQAVQIAGVAPATAAAGLQQFAQGLAAGAVQGDELRSVVENLPPLADAIAHQFGITGGELRAFNEANPGIITTAKVIKALLDPTSDLAEKFGEVKISIGAAANVLKNSFLRAVGELDQAVGFSDKLVSAIIAMADNVGILKAALAGLVTTLVVAFGPQIVALVVALERRVSTLFGVVAAGSTAAELAAASTRRFFASVGLVAGGIAAVTALRNEIKLSEDSTATLGDLFAYMGDQLDGKAVPGLKEMRDTLPGLDNAINNTRRQMVLLNQALAKTGDFDTFQKFINNIRRTLKGDIGVDEFIVSLAATVDVLIAGIRILWAAIKNEVKDGIADLVARVQDMGSTVKAVVDVAAGRSTLFQALDTRNREIIRHEGDRLKAQLDNAEEFAAFIEATGDKAFSFAKYMRDAIQATKDLVNEQERASTLTSGEGDFGPDVISAEALDRLKDVAKRIGSILKEIFPTTVARGTLEDDLKFLEQAFELAGRKGLTGAEGVKSLTKALEAMGVEGKDASTIAIDLVKELDKAGISTEQWAEAADRLRKARLDATAPVKKYIDDLIKEEQVLLDAAEANDGYKAGLEKVNELLDDNKELTDLQIDNIIRATEKHYDTVRALEAYRDLLHELRDPMKDYEARIAALTLALDRNNISQERANRLALEARLALLADKTDFQSGIERGFIKAQLAATDFATISEKIVTDSFDGIGNSIETALEAAADDFHGLGDAVKTFVDVFKAEMTKLLADIATLFIKLGIKQVIYGTFGNLFGQLGGQQSIGGSAGGGLFGGGGGIFSTIGGFFGNLLGGSPGNIFGGGGGTGLSSANFFATGAAVKLPGFAGGLADRQPFTKLPGVSGADSLLAQFRVSPGEQMFVLNRVQQRAAASIIPMLTDIVQRTGGQISGFARGAAFATGSAAAVPAAAPARGAPRPGPIPPPVTYVFNQNVPMEPDQMRRSRSENANFAYSFGARMSRRNANN